MEFLNLYNNSKFAKIVNSDINNNTLNHAYLLSGSDEVLNNYFAKQFTKEILCANKNCGKCATCVKVENNTHADVLVYPKSEKLTVVEDINDIVENVYIYPLEGDRRVCLIQNFEKSTIQAQNKLLKTLEEPPHTTVFVITTTNQNMLLNTIKSRVKLIEIDKLTNSQVESFLQANTSYNANELSTFVSSSQGNLTKAIKISNDKDFVLIKKLAFDVLIKLLTSSQILTFSSQILNYKNRLQEIFEEINFYILDIIYTKSNLTDFVINKDFVKDFSQSEFSLKALKLVSENCLQAVHKLQSNCNPTSVVDGFLIYMLEVKHKWK